MRVNVNKTLTYTALLDDSGADMLKLTLVEVNNSLRINVMHNGVVHSAFVSAVSVDGPSFIRNTSVPALTALLDPFSSLFNSMTPATLVSTLNARLAEQVEAGEIEASEVDELQARIANTSVASNLAILHNTFGTLVEKLYGPNWVSLHAAKFVGQSDTYLALVKRVELCKQLVSDEATN